MTAIWPYGTKNPALDVPPDQEVYTLILVESYGDKVDPHMCDMAWTTSAEPEEHFWVTTEDMKVKYVKMSMLEFLQRDYDRPAMNGIAAMHRLDFLTAWGKKHKKMPWNITGTRRHSRV